MRDNDRPAHVAQNGTKWHSVATFEVGEFNSPTSNAPKTTADIAIEMGIGAADAEPTASEVGATVAPTKTTADIAAETHDVGPGRARRMFG